MSDVDEFLEMASQVNNLEALSQRQSSLKQQFLNIHAEAILTGHADYRDVFALLKEKYGKGDGK